MCLVNIYSYKHLKSETNANHKERVDETANLFECTECKFKAELVSDIFAHIEFCHAENFNDGHEIKEEQYIEVHVIPV